VLLVSSDPAEDADYDSIQDAVDAAPQSGTTIVVLPGSDSIYVESVVVDRDFAVTIEGRSEMRGTGPEVTIDGGSGPAIDVLSTAGARPVVIRNLVLDGDTGVRAAATTSIQDVEIAEGVETGVQLLSGSHQLQRITIGGPGSGSIDTGIAVSAGASTVVSGTEAWNCDVASLTVAGQATVDDSIFVSGGSGIVVGTTGSASLTAVTVAGHATNGISSSGTVTLTDSILADNTGADLSGVPCGSVSWSIVEDVACGATNLMADPQLDASFRPAGVSPAFDFGRHPSTYDGTPCRDLDGGPRLRDHDGDGLARQDPGAHEGIGDTVAVGTLTWSNRTTMSWPSVAQAIRYHVYRLALTDLGYDDFGTCFDASDPDLTNTVLVDAATPAPGSARVYLVTFENASGDESSLGFATCAERSNFTPCVP
jgi:hypothetical protein